MATRWLRFFFILMAITVMVGGMEGREDENRRVDLFSTMITSLSNLPLIGNVLRAAVHPLYRPLVSPLQRRITNRKGEDEMAELCFGELGCITMTGDFFHPIHRPFNLPPNRREEVHVVFTVFTREEMQGRRVEALQVDEILNTTFWAGRPTKILIHGFLDHTGVTWMLDMLRALLSAEDLNIITVDWSAGSQTLYSQATANTRLVGLELAYLINWLQDKVQLNPKDVHIIGHSLGSHTAGYAGERVAGLGRITGLDPAEPFFQFMPPSVRLDPTDALFVDVIHTDVDSILNLGIGAGYGMRQASGHIDFYPNDGRSQPGCSSLARIPLTALTDGLNLLEGLDAAQKEFVACHHNRAAKLFTDSIHSACPYTSFYCPSYATYMKGGCVACGDDGSGCAHLGIRADTWTGSNMTNMPFYLSTTMGPGYCLYHYLLVLEVGKGGRGPLRGKLKVSVIKDDGNIKEFDLTPRDPIRVKRGGSLQFFVEATEDLSTCTEALVHWTYEADVFDPMSYCVLFCDTSLPIVRLVFNSVDMIPETQNSLGRSDKTNQVVMCHKQGLSVVKVSSESIVKVVSSPACLVSNNDTIANTTDTINDTNPYTPQNITAELIHAGIASLASILNIP